MPVEIWGAIATAGVFLLGQGALVIWGMSSLVGRVKTIEKNSTSFLAVVQEDHDRVIGLEVRADAREESSKDFRKEVAKRFDRMDSNAKEIAAGLQSLRTSK